MGINSETKKPTIQRIFLNHVDNALIGKYKPEADTIVVVLDSATAPFSVAMPPLSVAEKKTFKFFNMPSSGTGNDVTITARSINISDTSVVIEPWASVELTDSYSGYWLKRGDRYYLNHVRFNTDPENVPTEEGTVYYNDQDMTLDVVTRYATFQVGQELGVVVSNKTGSTILNGQVVYINGALGNRPTVALLDNSSIANCKRRLGIATMDIENNAQGVITTNGLVRDYDTSSYSEGDQLYVSGTPGGYTTTVPAVGLSRIMAAMVIRSHVTQGVLLVILRSEPYMFGDRDGGDYSVFEDDGTLKFVGDATVWEDMNFAVVRSGGPVANRPDDVTINNVFHKEFTSLNNQMCGDAQEIEHSALLGQSVTAHAHIFLKSGESAGTTGVTFTIYYEIRDDSGVATGSKTLSATSAQLTANPYEFRIDASTTFDLSDEIGAQIALSLYRTAGDAGDVIVTTYGFHFEKDTVGSRTANAK